MTQVMSKLQELQTHSSHQEKDQNKMIADLSLKLEQLNAFDKELKRKINDFEFKIYDEVELFDKYSDNIRSIVQFKARRTIKYEESPEINKQILHKSSKNHPPPVKPSGLRRFFGFFVKTDDAKNENDKEKSKAKIENHKKKEPPPFSLYGF
jgi:hypothetical protein